MSYIGNTSTTQAFTPAIDYFSGDGSTVAFTLSRPVASVAQVQVVVNNVAQNPSTAFTVSGNTITFTGAPSSGTNNIYVQYTSPITQVIAPGQGTVNTSSLANGTVSTSADITANGLTVGKGSGSVATNTAVGASALAANTTGSINTAVGYGALQTNNTGSNNTAVGLQALRYNTTGGNNAAVSYGALYSNTTGGSNTALGVSALQANTTASNNTAVGYQTLYSVTTGGYNTAIGYLAGRALTATGPSGNVVANTLVGAFAGYNLTTGYGNTIVGAYDNTTNAAPGYFITTGNNNTILGGYNGNQGGLDIRTSNNFVVLSDGAGNPKAYCNGQSGAWYLGDGALDYSGLLVQLGKAASGYGPAIVGQTGTIGSSTTRWGAGSNSWIKGGTAYDTYTVTAGSAYSGGVNLTSGATSWSSASDARLKNVTGTYSNALADISQIEAVKFTWKDDEEAKPQVGVIAQSVQGVVPEAIDLIRVSKDDETDYLSVKYTELIPLMIASIQELNAKVEAQAAEIAALKGQ